jgi:hypothetical protein
MSARETAALLLNRLVQVAGFVAERRPAQWTRLGFFSRRLVFPGPWNWRIFSGRSLQRTTYQVAGRRFD